MKAIRYAIAAEIEKVAEGKKSKLPVELVVVDFLQHHPAIQRKVAKALGVTMG